MEGGLQPGDGAGELDDGATGADALDGESLGLKPGGDGGQIGVNGAEARGELSRGEPAMECRRGGVLPGLQEGFQGLLVLGAAAQKQEQARRGSLRRGRAEIDGASGQNGVRAGERDAAVGVDGLGDERSAMELRGGVW